MSATKTTTKKRYTSPAKGKGKAPAAAKSKATTPAPKPAAEKATPTPRPVTGRFVGTVIRANPESPRVGKELHNPRRPGTHGWRMFEKIRKAGAEGISYEALRKWARDTHAREHQEHEAGKRPDRKGVFKGFLNHVTWDYERGHILVAPEGKK